MLKTDALRLTCGQQVQFGYHKRGRRGWHYTGTGRVVTVNHNGGVLVEDRHGVRAWHPYSDVHPCGSGEPPEALTGTDDDFA